MLSIIRPTDTVTLPNTNCVVCRQEQATETLCTCNRWFHPDCASIYLYKQVHRYIYDNFTEDQIRRVHSDEYNEGLLDVNVTLKCDVCRECFNSTMMMSTECTTFVAWCSWILSQIFLYFVIRGILQLVDMLLSYLIIIMVFHVFRIVYLFTSISNHPKLPLHPLTTSILFTTQSVSFLSWYIYFVIQWHTTNDIPICLYLFILEQGMPPLVALFMVALHWYRQTGVMYVSIATNRRYIMFSQYCQRYLLGRNWMDLVYTMEEKQDVSTYDDVFAHVRTLALQTETQQRIAIGVEDTYDEDFFYHRHFVSRSTGRHICTFLKCN